jgi:hypothetical protein
MNSISNSDLGNSDLDYPDDLDHLYHTNYPGTSDPRNTSRSPFICQTESINMFLNPRPCKRCLLWSEHCPDCAPDYHCQMCHMTPLYEKESIIFKMCCICRSKYLKSIDKEGITEVYYTPGFPGAKEAGRSFNETRDSVE